MAKNNRKMRSFRTIYFLLLMLVLLAAITWGGAAKYIQQREEKTLSEARLFYFASDLLTEDGANYVLNPATTEVTFTLQNHIDQLRYSDDIIQYDVYVNDVAVVKDGSLDADDDTITFSVEKGKTYNVRAVGRAGYEKTLTATFVVSTGDDVAYKHLDTSNAYYVLLTVWTESCSGKATVRFPDGLIPDATDEKLKDVVNYTDGSYTAGITKPTELQEYGSLTYRFFKEDLSSTYSVEDFIVSIDQKEAISGTP